MIRSYLKFAKELRSQEDALKYPIYDLFTRLTASVSERKFEDLADLLLEDALLEIHAPPNLLIHGTWKGKPDIVAAIARNFSMLEVQQFNAEKMVVTDDELFMFGSEVGNMKGVGTYAVKTAHWLATRDNKFSRLTEIVSNTC